MLHFSMAPVPTTDDRRHTLGHEQCDPVTGTTLDRPPNEGCVNIYRVIAHFQNCFRFAPPAFIGGTRYHRNDQNYLGYCNTSECVCQFPVGPLRAKENERLGVLSRAQASQARVSCLTRTNGHFSVNLRSPRACSRKEKDFYAISRPTINQSPAKTTTVAPNHTMSSLHTTGEASGIAGNDPGDRSRSGDPAPGAATPAASTTNHGTVHTCATPSSELASDMSLDGRIARLEREVAREEEKDEEAQNWITDRAELDIFEGRAQAILEIVLKLAKGNPSLKIYEISRACEKEGFGSDESWDCIHDALENGVITAVGCVKDAMRRVFGPLPRISQRLIEKYKKRASGEGLPQVVVAPHTSASHPDGTIAQETGSRSGLTDILPVMTVGQDRIREWVAQVCSPPPYYHLGVART